MPELHVFEYAVIRIVPRVERAEFLNVGVVLYCRQQQFLNTCITINEERFRSFTSPVDLEKITTNLQAFEQICSGRAPASPISQLDIAARFRWLTATRSTIVQTSKIHPGLCTNAAETLERLHTQLVL